MSKALKKSKRFDPPAKIEHLANKASTIVSIGNQTGEGWFLTGEMIELIESGAPNIGLYATVWLLAKSCYWKRGN